MFKWLKRLFKKKEEKIVLSIICGSITPTKPLKRHCKRDKKGRFTK